MSSSATAASVSDPSPQNILTLDGNTSFDVMSPSAMAYLLEVISADMSKAEDLERCRRNSGTKIKLPSVDVFTDSLPASPASNDLHRLLGIPQSPAMVDSTVFSYTAIANAAKNIVAAAATLADVTNTNEHQEDITGDLNGNVSKALTSTTPASAKGTKLISQRKRPAMDDKEDDVYDGDQDEGGPPQIFRSKKRSRSSSTSDGGKRVEIKNEISWKVGPKTVTPCQKFHTNITKTTILPRENDAQISGIGAYPYSHCITPKQVLF